MPDIMRDMRFRDHDGIVHLFAKNEGGTYVRCEYSDYTGVWRVVYRYAGDLVMLLPTDPSPVTCVPCLGARAFDETEDVRP